MIIGVDCYAGYRDEETPRRLHFDKRIVEVGEVLDRWLAPGHRYFKVRGADGATYLLRHDSEAAQWELVMYERAAHGPLRRL